MSAKKMTFAEAAQRLAEIAGPRYHSIKFELTTHSPGAFGNGRSSEAQCTLYMEGQNHVYGPTWEEAFAKLGALAEEAPDLMEMAPDAEPVYVVALADAIHSERGAA